MVSFVCGACQETVRKPQVDKHCLSCRACWVLTCVDCSKDFEGEAFRAHTSCMSEAEKYQGKLYVESSKGKKNPQDAWLSRLEAAQAVPGLSPAVKRHLQTLVGCENVPRKKPKFFKFCENSLKVRDVNVLEALWTAIESVPDPRKATGGPAGGTPVPAAVTEPSTASKPPEPEADNTEEAHTKKMKSKKDKKDRKQKRKSSVSCDDVSWKAIAEGVLAKTVTGNLHLAEFSAQCVAEAHTIHTDYSVDQLSSSLDAFVNAPNSGVVVSSRMDTFVSLQACAKESVCGFGAVVKGVVDPDADVRPVDALAEVVWQPADAVHEATTEVSQKKSKKEKKDKKRRLEREE